MGVLKYVVIGVVVVAVVAAALALLLQTPHRVPVQYVGSPSGYEAFVPNGQTINYNGRTDPVGDLILSNGTTIHNIIWDGKYSDTIIQNHNQMVQLNDRWVGRTDPVNNQPYVPLQDFYVIKGQVPIENVTINGQTYYVIDADKINPANIAGFFTYWRWVSNFVAAMNTPGVIPAGLPGNSPVFTWENLTGTVAYETMSLGPRIRGFSGGVVLVLPNGTMIPYGTNDNVPGGMPLFNFTTPQEVLWYINSSFVPLPAGSSPPS
jgi:hypothetical protein